MNWLSIHFYPNETQDVFLARALKPFLEQHVWPRKDARAFFIRYQDDKGPHIRIRLGGEQALTDDVWRPAFEASFDGRGEWHENPYLPETERFGGTKEMELAEEHFHISTRVVLDRISRDQFTYGDAMFDALRLLSITAFGAGFSKERAKWYFGQLFDQWLPLFFPLDAMDVPEITASFEKTFSPQQAQLTATLEAFWKALETEQFDHKQPEWIRWLRGNELILKGFGDNLGKALPSLIHLSNNRLGINNQDEVYLNYILSKAL